MIDLIIERAQQVLSVPETLISHIPYIPEYVKEALITTVYFVPVLYFLYYLIELLERFFLKNIGLFIKLVKRLGPIWGALTGIVPECGYAVIGSVFYARKMITRGTLLAFLIASSDDALPFLFMDLSKAIYIIPILVIKLVLAVVVAFVVDLLFVFKRELTEDINAINIDLNEPGCCDHKMCTIENPPYWWTHPLIHTFNMFMFTFLSLVLINCVITKGYGSVEATAANMLIDTPYQVILGAVFGLIPNCVISIVFALLFVKGLISFPTLLAGLITSSGIALMTLAKHNKSHKNDNAFITFILFVVAVATGLAVYYNMGILDNIYSYIFQ